MTPDDTTTLTSRIAEWLNCSLYGTDDAKYHVGDDEHDYDDGGVLDKGSGEGVL